MLENAGNKGRIFHCDFYSIAEMLLNKQFAHLTLLRTGGRIIDSFRGRGVDDGYCGDQGRLLTNNIRIRKGSLGNSFSFPPLNETSHADNARDVAPN